MVIQGWVQRNGETKMIIANIRKIMNIKLGKIIHKILSWIQGIVIISDIGLGVQES